MIKYYFYKILHSVHLMSDARFRDKTKRYSSDYKAIYRSKFFNRRWYLTQNPDVRAAHVDPVNHYLKHGWTEGRNPGPKFNNNAYLSANPDVALVNMNPLAHYERFGRAEGRNINIIDQQPYTNNAVKNWPIFEGAPSKFSFENHTSPLVSIIIPVYNQYKYTHLCLWSILCNTVDVTYEIIIADDCSTDDTTTIQDRIGNITVVKTPQNMRFLRNCNNAAKHARGKYILFLNNDTQVTYNWLKPLLDLIQSDENIGMVGSKLIYPDGTLQEAGGIIWKNASGMNFGNKQNPLKDEYNYVKDVDYISGASIMLERNLWDELGGFDETFVPAYYEDTDLAFRIHSMGKKVMFQPLSVVIHFEGRSNGTDTSAGQKHYQVINAEKFKQKWAHILNKDHSDPIDIFFARDRSQNKKTLLFIDWGILTYDKDCGSRASFEYLKFFADQSKLNVKYLPACKGCVDYHKTAIEQLGIEIICNQDINGTEIDAWLQENGKYIDYIYLNRPNVANQFLDRLKKYTTAKIIYQGHDLHHLRLMREYAINKHKVTLCNARHMEKMERELLPQMDVVTYFSDIEIQKLQEKRWPIKELAQVPLYVFETPDKPGVKYDAGTRHGIMFIGGYNHTPNVGAAKLLINQIMPLVWRQIPNLTVHLVGSNTPPDIMDLASDNVIVHGFMSDEELNILYGKIKMSVLPLQYGAGIKGKVLEAIYNKVPVITTDIGAEGIPNSSGIITVRNSVDDIAQAIIDMYSDNATCQAISDKSADFISQNYSVNSLSDKFKQWIEF